MRRPFVLALVAVGPLLLLGAARTAAQGFESIPAIDVRITIEPDGSLVIHEQIAYDFGSAERHGIIREIPSRFRYDDVYDRVYEIEVVEVAATAAPDDVEVSEERGYTVIRVGDPDVTVSGLHTYDLTYRVEGALNGFADHDELYWNAIGVEWTTTVDSGSARVIAPAPITRVACYQGPIGSTEPCAKAVAQGDRAEFRSSRALAPGEGLTVVVAFPKGAVPDPAPILVERWSPVRAFALTPTSGLLGLAVLGASAFAVGSLSWRTGRDRRFRGSAVDQTMGGSEGDEPVPVGDADTESPVEFAPPEDVRPGEIGTLIDERANVLDVTSTIIDLAVRGYLLIQEIPKEGWFGKPDWRLIRLQQDEAGLRKYERKLLAALFRDGDEVAVSELKLTFAKRLEQIQEALYDDVMDRAWFRGHPAKVRQRWVGWGVLALLVAGGLTFVLAWQTHLGLVGLAAIAGAVALIVSASRMPSRTAEGTAMLRRVRGFRRVIETAETHQARWAEQEKVFTRFLPYAVVFGLTERWAKAFAALGVTPETTSFYVGSRAFALDGFADSIDAFSVTTGGTLASTPSSSGSSGFGGGGSSGGGGGGGGGGSW